MIVMDRINNYLNNHDYNDNYYVLALFIRNNIEKISKYNTTELAKYSFTSQSTVSRFIKKLGYLNYSEFKDAVNEYLYDTLNFDDRRRLSTPLWIGIFQLLDYQINQDEIRKLSYTIKNYQNIYVTGLNFSCIMAEYFQACCHVFRKNINVLLEDEIIKELNKQDLLIVLTGSGNYFLKERGVVSRIKKCEAYKIMISVEMIEKSISDKFDRVLSLNLKVGDKNNHYVMMALIDLICDELRKSF